MKTPNDGGPAFPLNMEPCRAQHYDAQGYQVHGMTLRQWYAGQALPEAMRYLLVEDGTPFLGWAAIAKMAFEMADAVIAEGEKGRE